MEILVLPIVFSYLGQQQLIYPSILKTQAGLVLVDCGYEGFLPLIESAASDQRISLDELHGIILTHHDIDHMGAAAEFRAKYSQLKFYASPIETEYIEGRKKSARLQQAEALYNNLPEEYKPGARNFQESLKHVKPVQIDHLLTQNSIPGFLDGVELIETPGHMPGHISLFDRNTGTLVAADAVVVENGELEIANPQFTLDLAQALESVRKLQLLPIKTLICYHGGIVEEDIGQKLQALVEKYSRS